MLLTSVVLADVPLNVCGDPFAVPAAEVAQRFREKTYWNISAQPVFDINSVRNWRRKNFFARSASNNDGVFIGIRDGHKLVYKRFLNPFRLASAHEHSQAYNEAGYAHLMSDMQVAPLFRGLVIENNVLIGLVTDYVDGTDADLSAMLFSHPHVNRQGASIRAYLDQMAITPWDFQARMGRHDHRLWVIDTAMYRTDGLRLLRISQDELVTAIEAIQNYRRQPIVILPPIR